MSALSVCSVFAVSFHSAQWNKAEMAEKLIFKRNCTALWNNLENCHRERILSHRMPVSLSLTHTHTHTLTSMHANTHIMHTHIHTQGLWCLHHMGRYFFPSHCQGTGPRTDTQTLTKALRFLGGWGLVGGVSVCMFVCVYVHNYNNCVSVSSCNLLKRSCDIICDIIWTSVHDLLALL